MNKPFIYAILLGITWLFSMPADASGPSDMDHVISAMEKDNPADFEQVMRTFVDYARKGNIDAMVKLTSKITISNMGGVKKVKEFYEDQTVAVFRRFTKISEGGVTERATGAAGSTGWNFKKVFAAPDGKEIRMEFSVLRENGKICITGFELWK